jgi:hypothetical protein
VIPSPHVNHQVTRVPRTAGHASPRRCYPAQPLVGIEAALRQLVRGEGDVNLGALAPTAVVLEWLWRRAVGQILDDRSSRAPIPVSYLI